MLFILYERSLEKVMSKNFIKLEVMYKYNIILYIYITSNLIKFYISIFLYIHNFARGTLCICIYMFTSCAHACTQFFKNTQMRKRLVY